MDWFTILLVFIFFVLPLLEQLLSARRKGAEHPDLPREEPEWLPRDAPVQVEEGWSGGWGEWPGAEEHAPEEAPAEVLRPRVPPGEIPALPEAERVASPVVSLEPLEIDRTAEHRRFHTRYLADPVMAPVRARGLGAELRHPGEVRRALVLAAVLGPPRALRSLEDERD